MSRHVADYDTRIRESKTFRLTDAEDTSAHSLYRVYDGQDQLLYIGCARDVVGRIYMHMQWSVPNRSSHAIQRHISYYTTETYPTKVDAREAERAAIAAEAPLLNNQHNPNYDPANLERLVSTVTRDLYGPWPEERSA